MVRLFVDTGPLLDLLIKAKGWERISNIMVKADVCTSCIVLSELKFKLLWHEAGRVFGDSSKKYELVKRIKTSPTFTRQVYGKYMEFFIFADSKIEIFPLSKEDELLACDLAMKYSLLPNDSLILAAMAKNGVAEILTFDSDFEKIPEVKVIRP